MKRTILFLSAAALLSGCMRDYDEITPSNDYSSFVIINAAPASATAATNTNGVPLVDGILQSGSSAAYAGNSGYLSVAPGNRTVSYVATTIDSARLFERTDNFDVRQAYTYVAYDTVAASQTGAARRVRSIRLRDNLSLAGKQQNAGYIRILHLSPTAPPVDVTFVRTNVATPDSVTVSNLRYIGASPTQAELDALSNFSTTLPYGFAGTYTIRVKLAGTQTLAVAPATVALTTQAINQSFVTLFITGGAQTRGVGLGLFRHYP